MSNSDDAYRPINDIDIFLLLVIMGIILVVMMMVQYRNIDNVSHISPIINQKRNRII